jgi:hypothetical protein
MDSHILKSDLSDKNLHSNEDSLDKVDKSGLNLFPSFDNRQISKLNQSFYSNQKRYNPRVKPQNHVLIRQAD